MHNPHKPDGLNQKKGVMTILSIQECRYLQSFGGQMEDPAATLGMRGREFLLIVIFSNVFDPAVDLHLDFKCQ